MEDVRVYSKYTEIKPAAIRGRIPILNSEIVKMKVIKERLLVLTVKENKNLKE